MIFEPAIVLAALMLEAVIGYPAALHARIPHPVVWAGNAIAFLERCWNKPRYSFAVRRLLGLVLVVLVVGAAIVAGWGVQWLTARAVVVATEVSSLQAYTTAHDAAAGLNIHVAVQEVGGRAFGAAHDVGLREYMGLSGYSGLVGLAGMLFIAFIGTVGLAQRSLFDHVRDVLVTLRSGDLLMARQRVSMIVGRDTQRLDSNAVAAAALESLAESFNDGIVAPAFWFLVAGLPGLFAYKVLNTADSLIGHTEERWRAFGWAAARADDVANLVPARLAGALLVVAGFGGAGVMISDASKHASPNAGWPEAAMAGALGVRLGGPTAYDGVVHERPVFGSGPAPDVEDLARGLKVYVVACGLLWLAIAVVALVDLL